MSEMEAKTSRGSWCGKKACASLLFLSLLRIYVKGKCRVSGRRVFTMFCIFIATPTVLILLAPDSGAGEQLSSSLAPPVLIISLFGLSFGVFQSFKCDSNAI